MMHTYLQVLPVVETASLVRLLPKLVLQRTTKIHGQLICFIFATDHVILVERSSNSSRNLIQYIKYIINGPAFYYPGTTVAAVLNEYTML